jgi:hypothetical protein
MMYHRRHYERSLRSVFAPEHGHSRLPLASWCESRRCYVSGVYQYQLWKPPWGEACSTASPVRVCDPPGRADLCVDNCENTASKLSAETSLSVPELVLV